MRYSLRDRRQHPGVDVACDQVPQRRGLEQARAEQSRQPLGLQQVRHLAGGEDPPERFVIGRAQESERRDQRAGAGAGHDRELRPCPARRPAGQEAGAECAVAAAAGERQDARLRGADAGHDGTRRGAADGGIIGPQAGTRNAGNGGDRLLRRRIGHSRRGGGAAGEGDGACGDHQRTQHAPRQRRPVGRDRYCRRSVPHCRQMPPDSPREQRGLGFVLSVAAKSRDGNCAVKGAVVWSRRDPRPFKSSREGLSHPALPRSRAPAQSDR